jgi:hypothetical protein
MENILYEQQRMLEMEKEATGSSPTKNKTFDQMGFLTLPNLVEVGPYQQERPEGTGSYSYNKKGEVIKSTPVEDQVLGSLSRYGHPSFAPLFVEIKLKIQEVIGKKLLPTYYYDRFYSPGQTLTRHVDRPACEISVTLHIGSNLEKDWPIWIKTPDKYEDSEKLKITESGIETSCNLAPGDGMLYKGCERPHWRNPMPSSGLLDDSQTQYHQVFFHYVLADGERSHYAFDMGNG